MADESLTRKSARELVSLVKSRSISPVDVLDAHLAAIARLNPTINAVVTLAEDDARKSARSAEEEVMRGDPVGSMHGLPIGVKDITLTAGIRTTFGSPIYKDHVPSEDAEVVRRLKRAGAIILAKTNTPEFATGANTVNPVFGATHNPWNTELSSAGSSGGSAAAVAAGMLPIAQGTDFGCSIRIPAAFCGIVGIRPTPGLTPNDPMPLAWDSGQVHGPLARSAEDAALFLDAIVGFSRLSPISFVPPWKSVLAEVESTNHAKGIRIAYAPDIAGIGVDDEVEAICRRTARTLGDAGASVTEIEFDASDGRDPYQTLRGVWMVGQQVGRLAHLEDFGPNLRGNIEAGLKVKAIDIANAERVRQEVFHRFGQLLGDYDLLLTPTAPVRPYPITMDFPTEINGKKFANYIEWIAPAFLITLVSLPAASVPAGLTKNGLPVGLQIVGPRFEEPKILSIAKLVQQCNPIGWPPHS